MCYQGGVGMVRTYAITVVVIVVVVCACKIHRRNHVQSMVTSSLRSVPLLGRLGRLAMVLTPEVLEAQLSKSCHPLESAPDNTSRGEQQS